MKTLISATLIEDKIFLIRGQKVMLDSALAELYGVTTKRLNEQVKRNSDRFPKDFMFQLTEKEVGDMRSQIVTAFEPGINIRSQNATASRRNIRYLPYAFTEHGAIMAASVLNSKRAIDVSVYVVRAFVRLRQALATNKELAHKLAELERKVASHDGASGSLMVGHVHLPIARCLNAECITFDCWHAVNEQPAARATSPEEAEPLAALPLGSHQQGRSLRANMAGDWIKFEHATLEKPEVLRAAEMLGLSRDAAVGLFIRYFVWLDKNMSGLSNGFVTHVSRTCLDDVMQCTGFAACLEAIGWAKFDAQTWTLEVVNGERHNGKPAKTRALGAKRQAEFRNAAVTQMSANSVTREEKRRVTKISPCANRVDTPASFRILDCIPAEEVKRHRAQGLAEHPS